MSINFFENLAIQNIKEPILKKSDLNGQKLKKFKI